MGGPAEKRLPDVMSPALVGHRLRAAREALGLSKAAMADSIGVDRSAYIKNENGARLIAADAAFRLAEIHGLTMDYIYRGRLDDVRADLRPLIFASLRDR